VPPGPSLAMGDLAMIGSMGKPRKEGTPKTVAGGLLPAGLGGLILGLLTQIHYLGFIAWELPWIRILLGMSGGFLIGCLFSRLLGKGLSWIRVVPKAEASSFTGWALLITAAVAWPFWDDLALRQRLWIFGILWPLIIFVMLWASHRIKRLPREEGERRLVLLLLVPVLAWGIFLRFSGMTHGLPDYIVHCDTPKQLALIPHFVEGNLEPPGRYPVGHIYLYAGVIRLWKAVTGQGGSVPAFSHETRREFYPYLVAVRSLQCLLSAAIPLFIFFFCRRLWGPWVGLLAAFLVASDPIHLSYSRQEMGEIPQFFWMSLSLVFAGRIFSGGFSRDGWWAGFFAGLAVATKMYGGYVVLGALGAVFFQRKQIIRKSAWVILGLVLGILMGSPYFWLDPGNWWNNTVLEAVDEFFVRAPHLGGSRMAQMKQGLIFLGQGLNHRFHLPWILFSLMGIGLLLWRHQKRDLFFLIPFSTACLLIGFALTYLREWDLVHLTPYLAVATAVFFVHLREAWRWTFWRRKGLAFILALFLLFQGSVALRDALLARLPDTRELAREWVLRQADEGTRLFFDTNISGANWIPVNKGLNLVGIPFQKLLTERQAIAPSEGDLAVVERAWWDPPFSQDPAPLQVFNLRSTYFENPEIAFFRLSSKKDGPKIILPHGRVHPPGPAFLDTPWAFRQPLDLLSDTLPLRDRYLFAGRKMGPFFYVLLGEGQGSLQFGPAVSFPIRAELKTLKSGVVTPIQRIFPWFPRSYRLSVRPKPDCKGMWLGVFPDGLQAFPLLARYGSWAELEALARPGKGERDVPAEARLFYAAALAAQQKKAEAERELAELEKRHPGFLEDYRLLATDKGDLFPKLRELSLAGQAALQSEDVYWPARSGDLGELDQKEMKATVLIEDGLFHVWLPQVFLPGFFRAEIRYQTKVPLEKGRGRLRIISVRANTVVQELARIDLQSGQGELKVPFQIQEGPVRLECRLESDAPSKPEIKSLHIAMDYGAEFSWRRRLFQYYLGNNRIP